MSKVRCSLFLIVFISGEAFSQSPWIQHVNDGFLQLNYSGLYYDAVRLNNEVVKQSRKSVNNTYQLYLDFGLLPGIGVTAVLPLTQYNIIENNSNSTFSGFGNPSFTLRYELPSTKIKSVLGLTYVAKTSSNEPTLGLRTGFDAMTFMPFVSVGNSTNRTHYYANLGYGIRTNQYSDFVRLSGEIGYRIIKNAYIIGTFDLTNPTQKSSGFYKTDPNIYKLSSSYLDRQSFYAIGIKVLYEFVPQRYGLSMSTIGALCANNVPYSLAYNFGLYKKF